MLELLNNLFHQLSSLYPTKQKIFNYVFNFKSCKLLLMLHNGDTDYKEKEIYRL